MRLKRKGLAQALHPVPTPWKPVASDGEDSDDGDSAFQEGNESEEKDKADSDG